MILDGKELAGFIKERQARQVRALNSRKLWPKLAIVSVGSNAASASYIKAKQKYGQDIGVEVEHVRTSAKNTEAEIKRLNGEPSVHGIIVQLPLPKEINADQALASIKPSKDVDGLGGRGQFVPATPTAILWLLSGYNIELAGQVLLIGRGRLVGKPLVKVLTDSKVAFTAVDEQTPNLARLIKKADIIISATGQPSLLNNQNVKLGAIVVDAGTAEANGKLVGDANPELYKRDDIKISPVPGGVGPLTVCALFENLLTAAG